MGQACIAGKCTGVCGRSQSFCGGQCVDPKSDPMNCGGCGMACRGGANATPACVAAACANVCAKNFLDCNGVFADGCEVNAATDAMNCGLCGNVCPGGANGTGACANGNCGIACNMGYMDCDRNPGNGCEVRISSDPSNCGACGKVCPAVANAVPACANNACGFACNMNFGDCNKMAGDGCEAQLLVDGKNCGACGTVCQQGQSCINGACIAGPQWVFADYTGMQTKYDPGVHWDGTISCPTTCGFIGLKAVGVRFICNVNWANANTEGCDNGNDGQYGRANCGRYIDQGVLNNGTNGEDCSSGLQSCVNSSCSEGVTWHAIQCQCM
jgi:hypothetical protein